jgi:hypothetical protein
VGDDHVEVESGLRSAAAFGFREVLLEDRGAGWFDGSGAVRREARAAARRHKNPLRIQRATLDNAARFEEIVLVTPCGPGTALQRERLTHGKGQLIIVGHILMSWHLPLTPSYPYPEAHGGPFGCRRVHNLGNQYVHVQ